MFKRIPDFPKYRINKEGKIQSCWSKHGHTGDWRDKPAHMCPDGYLRIVLHTGEGTRRWFTIGELILTTFRGPRPKGQTVRHLNAIKTDNQLSNLRWGTYKQNEHDKIKLGLSNRGSRNGMAKLNESQVKEVRKLAKLGKSDADIAEAFAVSRAAIYQIRARKRWVNI